MSAVSALAVDRGCNLAGWLRARRTQCETVLVVIADLGAIVAGHSLDDFMRVLDDDERRRFRELRFASDRATYAASHAVLRAVIGIVLGCDAAQVRFEPREGRFGPLRLAAEGAQRARPLSLSHAGHFVAVAVGTVDDVGVDVEPLRPGAELEPLCQVIYSVAERRVLDAVPLDARASAILRAWTAKEAVLKALGVGFAVPPREAVLRYQHGAIPYAGCVALNERARALRVWSFDPAGDGSTVAALAASADARVACAFADAATLFQPMARSTSSDRSTSPPTKRSAVDRLRKNASGSP